MWHVAGNPLFSPRYIMYFYIEKEEVKQRVHLQSTDGKATQASQRVVFHRDSTQCRVSVEELKRIVKKFSQQKDSVLECFLEGKHDECGKSALISCPLWSRQQLMEPNLHLK